MFVSLQVTQLEELLTVRHSVFVVGGPGTGKSQVSFSTTTVSMFTMQQQLLVCQPWDEYRHISRF